jgi:polyhydroxyalkanoate synthase subunit PhaC
MNHSRIPVDLIMAKLAEDAEKAQERVQKAQEVLLGELDTAIACTPCDIVYEEDRVKLKHYKPLNTAKERLRTPLLLVYALINRETMLDLQPGRSVVENFLAEGIDVYMMDWGYPTRKDRYVTIDDHVNGYMDNVIEFIRRSHDQAQINLMGICMGGAFSVMYAALHPEKIKNLITTVTPTNFDTDKGLLHIWMKGIDADRMIDAHGNIPGDVMNIGFLLMNPARLMIDKYVGFLENMDNKPFVENFMRMEKWIFDSPDIPGETFRQFVKDCYQKNLLIQSKMELGGRRVDLRNITMPLLNFYGKYDHLVPPEACELLTRNVGSKDTEDVCLDTGHIGIYVSSKCQREFAPKIARWLKDRDGAASDAPGRGAPVVKAATRKIGGKSKPASGKRKSSIAANKETAHAAK